MQGVNCIGLFCEDIREEKSGAFTLIGIMPDNVNTEIVPVSAGGEAQPAPHVKMINKICLYVRLNFDPEIELPEGDLKLIPSSGEAISLGKIPPELITRAKTEAKEKGNLLAGVVLRAEIGGYPVPPEGSLKLELVFPTETILAGALHFRTKVAETTSPTA